MFLHIPYGKGFIDMEIEARKGEVFLPQSLPPLRNLPEALRKKFEFPLDTPPLSRLCRGKERACIVVDDNTRPPLGKVILPHLLPYLKESGIEKVIILIALGLHTPVKEKKIEELLGRLPSWVTVRNHKPEDTIEVARIDGISVKLNSIFLNSPLKIIIGDVELHQIFGYGGGMKSLLPGISDRESTTYLHSFLIHPDSGPGKFIKNPVQKFLTRLYEKVVVDFSLQCVLNQEEEIVNVFSGTLKRSFIEGRKLVDRMNKIKVEEEFDMLILSPGGFPRDIDLYQTQKVINMSFSALKRDGKMLIFSECSEGLGPRDFEEWVKKGLTGEEIERKVREKFSMGLHKLYLFFQGTQGRKVYLFSSLKESTVKSVFLHPVVTLREAKSLIAKIKKVGFVPYATTTLLEKVNEN